MAANYNNNLTCYMSQIAKEFPVNVSTQIIALTWSADQSLPTPVVRSSNPVIGKVLKNC